MANAFQSPNPYRRYDSYEAHAGLYRFSARHLAHHLPVALEGRIYDGGCGTGNSTLEIAQYFWKSRVTGIDSVPQMLAAAEIKFGFQDAVPVFRELLECGDIRTLMSLIHFKREAGIVKGRVDFSPGDVFEFSGEPAEAFFGAHLWHWLDHKAGRGAEAAAKLAGLVRTGGYLALSSSANFYELLHTEPAKASFISHPFTQAFFDALTWRIQSETGTSTPPLPTAKKNPKETIDLIENAGFNMVIYKEMMLPPLSPETFLQFVLRQEPERMGLFSGTSLDGAGQAERREKLVADVLLETLKSCGNLLGGSIPSDTNPLFIFRRTA